MDDEREPFIAVEKADEYETPRGHSPSRWRAQSRVVPLSIAVHVLLLLLNVGVLVAMRLRGGRPSAETCYSHFPNALADVPFTYQPSPTLLTAFQDSPFVGPPSPETDQAWHDLMENMTIRVSSDELERGNQSSVPLPRGGHMAWLGVYHELHCIKMLRQYKFRSHYYPNMTLKEVAHASIHADHCLEMLRSAALCHADGSLTTFVWADGFEKPMLDTKRPPHVCVDWDLLQQGLGERVVSAEEMAEMRNPSMLE